MNSEYYVKNAIATESPITTEMIDRLTNPDTIRLLHAAMGLTTESAEFVDMLKKHIFYGKPIDYPNACEELGDSLWYVAIAIDVLKVTMNEIMTMNIDKLKLRYPEKFSNDKALNRDLVAERKLLEKENV